MKKVISLLSSKIIYLLFIIFTVIAGVIIYKDIQNKAAIAFVVTYIICTFALVIYLIIIAIMKLRKLKWGEVRKRLSKFITLLIMFMVLNYGVDYFFRPSEINLARNASIAIGLAFGLSFYDVISSKKREN